MFHLNCKISSCNHYKSYLFVHLICVLTLKSERTKSTIYSLCSLKKEKKEANIFTKLYQWPYVYSSYFWFSNYIHAHLILTVSTVAINGFKLFSGFVCCYFWVLYIIELSAMIKVVENVSLDKQHQQPQPFSTRWI